MAGSRRSSGTVKWFNPIKGFGFITPQDDSDELFVHFTAIRSGGYRTLSDGQPVEFLVDYADDGRPMAVDVTSAARSPRPGGSRGGGGRGRGGRGNGYGYGRDLGFRQRVGGGDGYSNDNVECYNCGGIGHFARDCVPRSRGVDGRTSRRGGGRGGGGGRGCYNCGEEGHFARECPNAET